MSTEVIILAQGRQTRLGPHCGPKQLLNLPACGGSAEQPTGMAIMARTVGQAFHLMNYEEWPTIVTWTDVRIPFGSVKCNGNTVTPAYVTLAEPGNSALKGIARYLERRAYQNRRYDRTIVLLGDVVYSWACLEAIWELSKLSGFVGTANLGATKGELWGVAWSKELDDRMMSDLRDALLRHPFEDEEYQHAQLRRWVSGWQRGDLRDHVSKLQRVGAYIPIDDYTHDIDVPHDLVLLPELSIAARADDDARGVTWNGQDP